ncbi:response regulator transcription factor [Baekduia sp.]|uniref:response regulator transcription factor n=1 Tax=Baekduia sp. TaxID=2600305 RepID=UPI002E00B6E5|nr:response regulator transcription factor [Baekduia sp.]
MTETLRSIVVVEDHPTVREGLCLVLEREGFFVAARAGTAEEGHAAIVKAEPDVALVDVDLPDGSGVELTRRLLRRDGRLGVLLYTGMDDPAVLEDALASGARGFTLKTSDPGTMLNAVRAVAAGGTFVDPNVRNRLARQEAPIDRVLTVREREVLGRLAEGLSVEAIAADLVLSTETIRTHVRNAMGKLGTRTRAHAIVVALRRGELAL